MDGAAWLEPGCGEQDGEGGLQPSPQGLVLPQRGQVRPQRRLAAWDAFLVINSATGNIVKKA